MTDSRKIGMIQKDSILSNRTSLTKINQTSALPPIKTERQETNEKIIKIKNELNGLNQKNLKYEK